MSSQGDQGYDTFNPRANGRNGARERNPNPNPITERREDLQGYSSGRRGYEQKSPSPYENPRKSENTSRPPRRDDPNSSRTSNPYHSRARERVLPSDESTANGSGRSPRGYNGGSNIRDRSPRGSNGRDRNPQYGRYDGYSSYGGPKQEPDAGRVYNNGGDSSRSGQYNDRHGPATNSYIPRNNGAGPRYYDSGSTNSYGEDRYNGGRDRYEPRTHREGGRNPRDRQSQRDDSGYNQSYHEQSKYTPKQEARPAKTQESLISDEDLIKSLEKSLEATKDVQSIEEIKIIDSRWGVKPKGFESVTAQRAKLSGLFPLPGHPRPVDFTKLEGAMSDGLLTSNDILNDASKIDPIDSRSSKILIVKDLDFEKVNYLKIVEFFNDYLKRIDIEQTSTQNIDSKRKTRDDKNLIIEFLNSTCVTIIASLDSLKLPFNLYKEDGEHAKGPEEMIELKIRRPKEYIVQSLQQKPDDNDTKDVVLDSPRKVTLIVSPEKTETEILDQLKTIGPINAFQLLREIGTKESLGIAFVEFKIDSTIFTTTQKELKHIEQLIEQSKGLAFIKNAFFSCIIPGQTSIQESPSDMDHLKLLVRNENVTTHPKSRVIQLLNIVTAKDLIEDANFQFIQQDIQKEAAKFGKILSMKIPRPANDYTPGLAQFTQPGLGKVFIEFENDEVSFKAIMELAGRYYNDRVVLGSFYDSEDYQNGLF